MIDFLGFEYDVVDSDVTGGKWHRYSDRPATFRIPLFNGLEPAASAELPVAYIVPAEWTDVIERLSLHGVALKRLPREWTVRWAFLCSMCPSHAARRMPACAAET